MLCHLMNKVWHSFPLWIARGDDLITFVIRKWLILKDVIERCVTDMVKLKFLHVSRYTGNFVQNLKGHLVDLEPCWYFYKHPITYICPQSTTSHHSQKLLHHCMLKVFPGKARCPFNWNWSPLWSGEFRLTWSPMDICDLFMVIIHGMFQTWAS